MKLSTLVLAGSLAANAAFIGMIAVGSAAGPGATSSATAHPAAATTGKTTTPGEAAAPGPEAWAGLQADDLAGQRDRLRAAGFPPDMVRAILMAQVGESFTARRKALEGAQGEAPFWKNPQRDPKMQMALRDLYREQEKIMKELLGRDARNDDPTYAAYLRRQFGDLPQDKVDQLRQIQDDYNQKRSELFANANGSTANMVPEERQKLADLDKAMRTDFSAVMTPQEFEEYEMRSSNTASQLRYNLAAFDATEQEYRAIYQLQQAFDDKYSMRYNVGPQSQEEMRGRMDAQKKLTEDIKAALGADRGVAYERATDYSFRQATQLVARLELPPENAVALWNTQKEFQDRLRETYTGGARMNVTERTQQLTALQQEAIAKVTPLLGGDPSRVEVYKQNGGQWLQQLNPPQIRPAIPPRQ